MSCNPDITDIVGGQTNIITCTNFQINLAENEIADVEVDFTYTKQNSQIAHSLNIESNVKNEGGELNNLIGSVVASYHLNGGATDSKNSNDGVITGADCNVNGQLGLGCNFDVGNNINVGYDPVFSMEARKDRTIMFWLKRNTVISGSELILNQGPTQISFRDGVYGGLMVTTLNQVGYIYTKTRVSGVWDKINDLGWHHYAFVFDREGDLAIYMDRNPVAITTIKDLSGGVDEDWTRVQSLIMGNQLDGLMDEVIIFDTVLTEEEIGEIYDDQRIKRNYPSNGLVTYWNMDGSNVSGTTLIEHYSGIDGTINGASCGNVEGEINEGCSFDAIDDFITIPFNANLNLGNTLSVSAWVNTGNLGSRQSIYTNSNDNTANAFWIEIGSGSQTNGVGVAISGIWIVTADNVLTPNNWHHIVYTRSGTGSGTHVIYVDGVSRTLNLLSPEINFVDNTKPKLIGARTTSSQVFNGLMDEVLIYDRALTLEEVDTIYNMKIEGTEFIS